MRAFFCLAIFVFVLWSAAVAQTSEQLLNDIKKEVSGILNVVDTEKAKLNQEIEELNKQIIQKEVETKKIQFDAMIAEQRQAQQEYFKKQVEFMQNIIVNPDALKNDVRYAGKVASRPIHAKSCLEISRIKGTGFQKGIHFIVKERTNIQGTPKITKQVYCATDASTLVGTINVEKRKKAGLSFLPKINENTRDLNDDDLSQNKCSHFLECFNFLPETTKHLEIVATVEKQVFSPNFNQTLIEKKLTVILVKANEPTKINVMMMKFFSLLEKNNVVLKESGMKCSFHSSAGVSICSDKESQIVKPEDLTSVTHMRFYVL